MRYTVNNNRRNAPEQVIVMKDQKVKKLVLSALMAALVYVATSIIQIPSPSSGSMLVDLLGGYAHYAPGTLVIKAVDAIAAALIFRALGRGKNAMLVSGIVGEVIMVLGYFAYASTILGKGLAAAASIPGNIVQGVAGIAIGMVLAVVLESTKVTKKAGLGL